MKEPWYKDGLRFKCTGCGKCCTGSPGYVWVSEEEIQAMSAFLQITAEAFVKKYTRSVHGRVALLEVRNGSNFDCIFLKNKACQVYGDRPKQCRTFPWWSEHLESKQSWAEAADYCEGINSQDAPLISLGEIQSSL